MPSRNGSRALENGSSKPSSGSVGRGIACRLAFVAVLAAPLGAEPARRGVVPKVDACFTADLSAVEHEAARELYGFRNPSLLGVDRFALDTLAWIGDQAQIGPAGQGLAIGLTYSFPDDSVSWGNPEISLFGPNLLGLRFAQLFGVGDVDLGREYVRQALAAWTRDSGLSLTESPDDGSQIDTSTSRSATRGDVRIGGIELGTSPVAFNFFPPFGADMVFNTRRFFEIPTLSNPADDYRLLRNVASHELGHGLGFFHVTPCSGSKLMEPFVTGGFEGLTVDDRRGAGANCGDRLSPNQAPLEAHDLGDLSAPIVRSVVERSLSTNGAAGPNSTGEDWLRFTLSSPQDVTIIADPTGGSYFAIQQASDCLPDPIAPLDAERAGDLTLELWNGDATVLVDSAVSAVPGDPEIITQLGLAAGDYLVRIADIGPNDPLDGLVQLYDLTIDVAGVPPSPQAYAGLDKRIPVGQRCWFIGDFNSRALASATFISSIGYDWDLDGDGMFEILGDPRPSRIYTTPGDTEVTLRVTDTNGRTATHSIMVTAYEPVLALSAVSPSSIDQGTTTPIVIEGWGLGAFATLISSQFTSDGITLIGTPVVAPDGKSISGLSIVSNLDADLGPSNLTLEGPAQSATGAGVFEIVTPANPPPDPFNLLSPTGGLTVPSTTPTLLWEAANLADSYDLIVQVDLDDDGTPDATVIDESGLTQTSYTPPLGLLTYKRPHTWSVTAVNANGQRPSFPTEWVFRTPPCPGDSDYSQTVDFGDITVTLSLWLTQYPAGRSGLGDSDGNASVDFSDIVTTLSNWLNQCP